MSSLPPAAIMIVGALALLVLPKRLRSAGAVLVPLASLAHWIHLGVGTDIWWHALGHELHVLRIDDLAFVFGIIFHIAAVLGCLFAWHVRDESARVSGLVYAGSTIGAVGAGDFISLFVCWELVAFASVFLITARRRRESYAPGATCSALSWSRASWSSAARSSFMRRPAPGRSTR